MLTSSAAIHNENGIHAGLANQLSAMRSVFQSGKNRSYEDRKQRLQRLRDLVLKYENELQQALYADLHKSPEEAWVTETGFVIAEINHILKHLKSWMRPKRVGTNLLNLPSVSHIHKEPLGVVLIVAPWNYPFQLLISPLAGALAAGNSVVLKPSEHAPATAAVMREMISEAFDESEVLYVGGEGAEVIPGMMKSFRFDHVFFTGGTAVGKIIYELAASKLVPVTLELGGKSPVVVEADANITVAAKRIAVTKFSNAGQMCIAPDYLLVHSSVKDKLVDALKSAILSFYTEDASNSYNYGRIINDRQFRRLQSYLSQGNILFGGQTNRDEKYIAPTLIEGVDHDSPIMKDEIFGPILPVISYDNMDEALSTIQVNPDPLAFYVFTQSKEKEQSWISAVPSGGACVNNASWHATNPHLPFGGRGNSGIGAYHGNKSFDCFSHSKAVMKTPAWFDPAIKYPPFKGKLNLFKKIIR